jgi:hypothetical protein
LNGNKNNERNRIFIPNVNNPMIRNITVLLFSIVCSMSLSAQTIRTKVTVVGGTAAGIAAGIQAARSGVKSLILEEGKSLAPEFTPGDLISLERIRDHYIYKSEAESMTKDSLKGRSVRLGEASTLVKSITDTVKGLTIMLNSSIRGIKKDGKGWEIKLTTGRSIKTEVLIDASKGLTLSSLLKIESQKTIVQLNNWINSPASSPRLFRTAVASGKLEKDNKHIDYLIPAATLMPAGIENIFIVPRPVVEMHPETMLVGQAAGASAAFCAYFKTTSSNLNVRVTQGELLSYDARLIPYSDIEFNDRHAIAFQHTGLSGILSAKSVSDSGKQVFLFDTLGTISSEEIRLPMKEFYSRSQIWFADHKGDRLSIEDVINMLMFTATRGEEMRREIDSGWKSSLKFNTPYEPKRLINRREFAVLIDRFLQPFNRRVDLSGKLLN